MSDLLYDGFLKIRQVEHKGHKLEVMDRGDSVNVLLVDVGYCLSADRFYIGTQYRAGANFRITTNVAGMVDPEESPAHTAVRESLEESGYIVGLNDLRSLGAYFNSPGGSTECTYFYVANIKGCDKVVPTDVEENVQFEWMTFDQAVSHAQSLPCLASLMMYKDQRENLFRVG